MVYPAQVPIVPNTLSNSGGTATQTSVSPPLPVGLTLNPQTGAISGTPTGVSPAAVYTVTSSNATGSASIRLVIEVKPTAIAPENLGYPDSSVIYVTNTPVTPETPTSSGGEITQYSVSPALPAGLFLDPQTGIISSTPTAAAASAIYTITGSNSAGSVQAQLSIVVQAQVAPPTAARR